jgi:hypothetical protein
LYAGGQIKVSCYPFFDTANKLQSTITCDDNPPTSAYQKKGTSQHGGSREEMTNLAPIAIGVEVRSQLETEHADRKRIGAELSDLKQKSEKFFLAASKIQFPDVVNNNHKPRLKSLSVFSDVKPNSEKSFLAASKIEFSEVATILSQLARQAQKIYPNAGVMLRKF